MDNASQNIQLSEEQINYLFVFVEKKFVKWYDLQIEIVDHLATSIENQMNAMPGLSFESALKKVYDSFGIFGFANIVKERQNYLVQSAKKRWWREVKNLFQWPGILVLVLTLSVTITISSFIKQETFTNAYFIITLALMALFLVYVMGEKKSRKPLLLIQYGSKYIPILWMFQFSTVTGFENMSQTLFIVLLLIQFICEFATFRVYRKVKEEAKTLYPAAFKM